MSYDRDGDEKTLDSKVYVGDLPRGVTERELDELFRPYGQLRSVWVARNPPGFAFIEYVNTRDADRAVRELDATLIGGVRVRVEHSSGKKRPKPWMRGPPGAPMGGRFDPYSGGMGGGMGGGMRPLPYDRAPPARGGGSGCYRCGSPSHFARDCRGGGGAGGAGNGGASGGYSSRRRSRSRSHSRSRSRSPRRRRSSSGSRSPPPRKSPEVRKSSSKSKARAASPPSSRSASHSRSRSASPPPAAPVAKVPAENNDHEDE
jgi:arginine/serine-rich splicing factor 7